MKRVLLWKPSHLCHLGYSPLVPSTEVAAHRNRRRATAVICNCLTVVTLRKQDETKSWISIRLYFTNTIYPEYYCNMQWVQNYDY